MCVTKLLLNGWINFNELFVSYTEDSRISRIKNEIIPTRGVSFSCRRGYTYGTSNTAGLVYFTINFIIHVKIKLIT